MCDTKDDKFERRPVSAYRKNLKVENGMNEGHIVKEKVDLSVADGRRMGAYVPRPAQAGAYPGLLLFQARQAWALTLEFLRS